MLPNNLHRKSADTAGRSLAWLLFTVFGLTSCAPRQPEGISIQPIQMKGMELYYGVVPAEMLLDHPKLHEEQVMHKGVPLQTGTHHLVVTVFDTKTRTRITDATITGSATEPGTSTVWKPLEIMSFGDAVSYGNYFDMSKPGIYEMGVKVRRPGSREPVEASFQYRHPK